VSDESQLDHHKRGRAAGTDTTGQLEANPSRLFRGAEDLDVVAELLREYLQRTDGTQSCSPPGSDPVSTQTTGAIRSDITALLEAVESGAEQAQNAAEKVRADARALQRTEEEVVYDLGRWTG
jgi:PE family